MASPKWHTIATLPLVIITLCLDLPLILTSKSLLVLILVILFGIGLDIDHLSIRRIKKLLRGEKEPLSNWVNYLHTWYGLLLITLFSLIVIKLLIPLIAYLLHILIDSSNENNKFFDDSPLSSFLYRKIVCHLKWWPKYVYDWPFGYKPPSN